MPDPEGFKAGSAWMDVKPNLDETEWHARIAAAVQGAAAGSAPQLASGLSKSIEDARPEMARSAGALGKDVADGIARGLGDAETPIMDEAERIGKGLGGTVADTAATETEGRLRDSRGRFLPVGKSIGDEIGKGLGDGLKDSVGPSFDDFEGELEDKAKKSGQDAGNAAGQGMSPLIISAFAGAATIGGPLLLAGIGTAMVGATALILKQNQVISADFTRVGKDAASMVSQAAAPLTGELHAALGQMDNQVTGLQPEFKDLFRAAEPDIAEVTTGLTGLAGGILPGVAQATRDSQVIVKDFSQSLPGLGQDIGGFFTGLVHDANTQGQALNQTIGALGNTVHTAGSLIGSASAAASADLLALTPVINGLDVAIQHVASPATVGGLLGAFGALKLDPKIQSGLLSGAEGLSKVADKAEGAGGLLGKVAGAAGGASGLLGKMAGVVGGPWGIAIGAGIGLASGLAAALFNADDATKAITVNAQDLAGAIASDAGKAGEATTAYVAQQAQLSGLADTAKAAGVPLDLLVQAATGNTQALGELETATSHANEAQRQQQLVGSELLTGQGALNTGMSTGVNRLNESLVVTNTLTSANEQLINSVKAQAQQTADAINKQTQLDMATRQLNDSTTIFDATLGADYEKLVEKGQATAQNTVAALNLGAGQSALNQSLADSLESYQLAAAGGSSYGSVLTSLNGTTVGLKNSEAGFTIALANMSSAVAANGHSLDINNAKGAANIQAFTGIASSADKAAVAVYQSELTTKGATQAYTDANAKLAQERDAFEQAAIKAGFSKSAVKELADELYHLPPDINIPIDADTNPARQALNGLIQKINSSSGTVQVYASPANPTGGKAYGANASGGLVTAGSFSTLNEHGLESAYFGQDAYIFTHGQTVAMQSQAQGGASAKAPIEAHFHYYGTQQPDPEQKASMMRDLAGVLA